MSKLPALPKGEQINGSVLAKNQDKRFINALDLLGMGTINVEIDRVKGIDHVQFANGQSAANAVFIYIKDKDKPINASKACLKSAVMQFGSSNPSDWLSKKVGIFCHDTGKPGNFKYGIRFTKPTN